MREINAKVLMNENIAKASHARPVDFGMVIPKNLSKIFRSFSGYLKTADNGVNQQLAVNEFLVFLAREEVRNVLQRFYDVQENKPHLFDLSCSYGYRIIENEFADIGVNSP